MELLLKSSSHHKYHIVVIVLGDVGRSPRMQYHTLSLLENGYHVSLVGYSGENLIPQLEKYSSPSHEQKLHIFRFQPWTLPSFLRKGVFKPMYYILRAMSLLWILIYTLFKVASQSQNKMKNIPSVQCVLVQNPPSIPLLFISFLFCKIQYYRTGKHVGFIIDWHNLGFTMFENHHPTSSFSLSSWIRRFTQMYEIYMAPKANLHFCVSQGMKQWLIDSTICNTKIMTNSNDNNSYTNILVLYDRPPDFFLSTSIMDKHILWKKLNTHFWKTCPHLMSMYDILETNDNKNTLLTIQNNKKGDDDDDDDGSAIMLRKNRPAILISSTSWTPDEDFSILLQALIQLDTYLDQNKQQEEEEERTWIFSHVLVIVTGKGPLKALYVEKIERLSLKYVTIQTMWLEAEDYPRLLGCADLGISLHTSTSGIDLPMKVVDMFGCQVPVCAMNFSCISELVTDRIHGRLFTTSEELSQQLYDLIFTVQGHELLQEYRRNIHHMIRWRENWNKVAGTAILDLCKNDKVKVKVG